MKALSFRGLPCRLARTEQLQSPLCRDHKAYVRQFPSTFADPFTMHELQWGHASVAIRQLDDSPLKLGS